MRYFRLRHVAVVMALLLTCVGCSAGTETEEVTRDITVNLENDFSEDQATVELDGDVIFSGHVTSDLTTSLAEIVETTVSEGEHRLRVTVNGDVTNTTRFRTEDTAAILVRYDPEEKSVTFRTREEPVFYL